MSASGRACEVLTTWRNAKNEEHTCHGIGAAYPCDRCTADRDAMEVLVEAAEIMGWIPWEDDGVFENRCTCPGRRNGRRDHRRWRSLA